MAGTNRTPEWIIEYIFTHANPDSGSEPPEHVAWVVFENGTVFFSFPSEELPVDASIDAIEAAAKQALRELGPVEAGTPSADFNPAHLDTWFPGEYVYFVTFSHPAIASIVQLNEENELTAGLIGRAQRQEDLEGLSVRLVRGFTGEKRP